MIKKIILSVLMILIMYIMQTTVFQAFELAGVVPNLLLVVTVAYGYIRGRTHGMWIGFVCGLMLDMQYGSVIGLYGFIMMTIGFVIGFFRKFFFTNSVLLPVALISISDLAYGIYYYITEFLMRGRLHFGFFFLKVILPEIVYTSIAGVLVFYLISFLDRILLGDSE